MLVLGLILILLSVAAFVAAVGGGANDNADFTLGSHFLNVHPSTMTVFLLGAATLLVFVMGLELARSGARRAARRRRDAKKLSRLSSRLEQQDAQSRREPSTDTTDAGRRTGSDTTDTQQAPGTGTSTSTSTSTDT